MKKILVPTDYSSDAHNALLYALDLAQELKAEIVLLHAFYRPLSFPYTHDFTAVVNDLESEKVKELKAYGLSGYLSVKEGYCRGDPAVCKGTARWLISACPSEKYFSRRPPEQKRDTTLDGENLRSATSLTITILKTVPLDKTEGMTY